jgi:hypothetical protein
VSTPRASKPGGTEVNWRNPHQSGANEEDKRRGEFITVRRFATVRFFHEGPVGVPLSLIVSKSAREMQPA